MQDIIAGMVDVLQADSGVSALVGTRVFGLELPNSEAGSGNMPRQNVVLRLAGGTPLDASVKTSKQLIDALCYGETPIEAETLRRAVHDALKPLNNKSINNTLINVAIPVSNPIFYREQDTDWAVSMQTFEVIYQETALT